MLQIHDIVCEVLSGVPLFTRADLDINPGDRIGLTGPNGAGKSTLLRLLAGELTPAKGTVVRRAGLHIAWLPQEPPRAHDVTLFQRVLAANPRLCELHGRIDSDAAALADYLELDGPRFESRAGRALRGLGFVEESWILGLAELSSGQRMRAELARCLLSGADLMLLDEPTNHLDCKARDWLEIELIQPGRTFVLVSHDRAFLDRVTNRIVAIERGRVSDYSGNYSDSLAQRELSEQQAWRKYESAERRAAAERTAAEKRLQLSRKVAKAPPGVRQCRDFYAAKSARVARTARILLERSRTTEQVGKPWEESPMPDLDFSAVPRAEEIAVRASAIGKRFGDRTVFDNLTFEVLRQDRLILAGPNGCGKTTLLRIIAGDLTPGAGRFTVGARVRPAYLAQEGENLPPEQSALDLCVAVCGDETRVRTMLGCLRMPAEKVLRPTQTLSAGERTKAGLARLLLSQSNLLLLDEPSNHLEMEAREALAAALKRYPGAIVMATHDEWLSAEIGGRTLKLGDTIET